MRFKTILIGAVSMLVLGAGIAGCGGSDEDSVSGAFVLIPGAPGGYAGLTGEAKLVRSDQGTTTSVTLSGLVPNTDYVAHLHAAGCGESDPGGPHYKFDPEGSDVPPNEIHISFTSSPDGNGEAESTNEQEVPEGDAGSVVLHAEESAHEDAGEEAGHDAADDSSEHTHSDKIACAELEGGTVEESTGDTGGTGESGEGTAGDQAEADAVETIVVRDGAPVGGPVTLEFDAGETVRFNVRSNLADEVHVHGYDETKLVPAGGTAKVAFPADIEGIFEVELHESGELIAKLQINP